MGVEGLLYGPPDGDEHDLDAERLLVLTGILRKP